MTVIPGSDGRNYIDWIEEMIDSINDGILVIDVEGVVQFVNKEYTNITGVKEADIVGQPLAEVRKGAVLPNALKDGKRREGVYRKEGEVEYIIDTAPVYKGEEIVGAVSVCKSLNEVHYLTRELHRSQERIARLEKAVGTINRAKYTFENIIGREGGLRSTIELAKKAAHSNLNILIQGESGTGKELFAHALHNESDRASLPFIPINCAAIPSSLLESELFGYEEGSFTSSKKGGKVGLFELADHGTLFLDEIGDMPYDLQAKLLRVLQERSVRKVGGLMEKEINIKIIAATNKDLVRLVEKDRFREDLYYRLSGIPISVPPLRDRKEDIPLYIDYVIEKEQAGGSAVRLKEDVMRVLKQYDWPGNARELIHSVQYALSMTETTFIELENLPEVIYHHVSKTSIPQQQTLKEMIRNIEQEIIWETIQIYGDTLKGKKKAADRLGISLATLYNKLEV
ncbi:PAS domain S-box-containing protein [Virgibacillus natechei]|uniref:PAS domain S-box-containing protein n=1 Tax=Virgibacillus natechei TaxID=1216297 RepID=A0ABS4IL91_9BACI|nr:sigma 54-interacting transcriptional regulator [Virgibacillus natechei]MBP1970779.1 PAS domain S-box-containing protein [Virgibacillus natechei]UZD12319.1 sigma 54-interacting transcriptional regulator [Virgibacillus natechei]